jgi:hypothetical protein
VAICCSHSKHEDKHVTKNKVIDESVFKYKFDTINNSRKTTSREKGHQSLPVEPTPLVARQDVHCPLSTYILGNTVCSSSVVKIQITIQITFHY